MTGDLIISATVRVPASDLTWSATRASGPGGQHVNKVSTRVELRFDLAGTSALTEEVKARLRRLAVHRLDADGQLIVTSDASRSQSANLEDTRAKLGELIRRALHRPKPRRPTRPTRGSVRRRLDGKKRQGERKRLRGRVSEP